VFLVYGAGCLDCSLCHVLWCPGFNPKSSPEGEGLC
jgi:hypothetical protein